MMRRSRLVRGQAMLEYLLLAGTVIAVLLTLNGSLRGAMRRVATRAANQLTANSGRADGLLR